MLLQTLTRAEAFYLVNESLKGKLVFKPGDIVRQMSYCDDDQEVPWMERIPFGIVIWRSRTSSLKYLGVLWSE
jgi:hypothetical protein